MEAITLVVDETTKSVVLAAGIPTGPLRPVPTCELQVGDFISYPQAPALAFQVKARMLNIGDKDKPPHWYLMVEKSPHPLA